MSVELNKLEPQSLKDLFMSEIERLIISDTLKAGQRLPPERDLATRMGVSRSVVNAGILELASKGFLRVVPRKGTFVNDYRHEGTLAIFKSLLNHLGEDMDLKLFIDTNSARKVLEVECARAAALNRTRENLDSLTLLMEEMKKAHDADTLISTNVQFHHQLAIASDNMILCVLLNSFQDIIKKVLSRFYAIPRAVQSSLESHALLLEDIRTGNSASAAARMEKIFIDSERIFREVTNLSKDEV